MFWVVQQAVIAANWLLSLTVLIMILCRLFSFDQSSNHPKNKILMRAILFFVMYSTLAGWCYFYYYKLLEGEISDSYNLKMI